MTLGYKRASVMFVEVVIAVSILGDGSMPLGVMTSPPKSTVCLQDWNLSMFATTRFSANKVKKSHTWKYCSSIDSSSNIVSTILTFLGTSQMILSYLCVYTSPAALNPCGRRKYR